MASVTVDHLGPRRFKVRWREWAVVGGTRKRRYRSLTVSTRAAAIELQARVLRAIETRGFYEAEAREVAPAPVEPPATNLETAAADWLRARAARGIAPSSVRKYAANLNRFFRTVREVRGGRRDRVVSADVLSRSLVADVILALRAQGLSESTIYGTTSTILDMWGWTSDDPEAYPGVPTPPRDASAVRPPPPIYTAPPAPTMAEVDACIRHISRRGYVARAAAVVMRFTGLRISQVLGVQCRDVDLAAGTMRIREGKSRREKAGKRVVPLSPHLVDEVRPWLDQRAPDEPLVRRRRDMRSRAGKQHLPSATISDAWEAASRAGEARRDVWAPENRKLARPEHAFRAAFVRHLAAEGVRDPTIDFLVGHHPGGVRARHYAEPEMPELKEAVACLPPLARSALNPD